MPSRFRVSDKNPRYEGFRNSSVSKVVEEPSLRRELLNALVDFKLTRDQREKCSSRNKNTRSVFQSALLPGMAHTSNMENFLTLVLVKNYKMKWRAD